MFRSGEQRTTPLRTAGVISFRCTIHPEMTGVIRVTAAAGVASTPGNASPPAGDSTATPAPATLPSPPEDDAPPSAADVSVVDFAFEPAAVRLPAGGTVTWRVNGTAPHTVSAVDSSFDSGLLEPAATFSHRFDEPGSYQYVCAFHPQMTGTIEVKEAASAVDGDSVGAAGEQAAAPLTGDARPASTSRGSVLGGLLAVAALLAGTGALLYGSSRMVAAGEGH